MDDLIGDFVADVRDAFDRLAPDLERWSLCPTDRHALDAVFRFIHTVRGNAGFLAFERFDKLCAPAERALAALRDGERNDVEAVSLAIVAIVERIGALATAIDTGISLPAHDEPALVAQLDAGTTPKQAALGPRPKIHASQARTVRMPAEQFDYIMSCVDDVTLSHRALQDRLAHAQVISPTDPAIAALSDAIDDLNRALTLSHMQPLERLLAGLDRVVSQLASDLGKAARLETVGGSLMVDRDIVDGLRETLLHLVRNALDHGIETPARRKQSGKPAEGLIRIDALFVANRLRLTLLDDGAGIDVDAVTFAAKRSGIKLDCPASRMTNAKILEVISQAGLSTAQSTHRLSGLGVGLDAACNAAKRLGGTLSLESVPGQGACFTLDIPIVQARAHVT